MASLIPILAIIFSVVFITLVVLKTILFFKNIRYKKFKYWLYFDKAHIINSSSENSEKAKRQQNTLTSILIVVLIIEIIMIFMIYKSM